MFQSPYFVPTVCSEAICQPCRISINQDDIALLLQLVFRDLQQAHFNSLKLLLPYILLSTIIPVKLVENITFQHQWLKFWFGSNEQKAPSCSKMLPNLNFQLRRVETNPRRGEILSNNCLISQFLIQLQILVPLDNKSNKKRWQSVCLPFDKIYL